MSVDLEMLALSVLLLIQAFVLRAIVRAMRRNGICMWPFCPPCERHCKRRGWNLSLTRKETP